MSAVAGVDTLSLAGREGLSQRSSRGADYNSAGVSIARGGKFSRRDSMQQAGDARVAGFSGDLQRENIVGLVQMVWSTAIVVGR